ncbi:hypothetical protein [Methylobacterium sp. JK268]
MIRLMVAALLATGSVAAAAAGESPVRPRRDGDMNSAFVPPRAEPGTARGPERRRPPPPPLPHMSTGQAGGLLTRGICIGCL